MIAAGKEHFLTDCKVFFNFKLCVYFKYQEKGAVFFEKNWFITVCVWHATTGENRLLIHIIKYVTCVKENIMKCSGQEPKDTIFLQ